MPRSSTVYFVGRDFKTYGDVCQLAIELDADHSFSSSVAKFFQAIDPDQPGCVVCENHAPDVDDESLLKRLREMDACYPVILLASPEQSSIDRAVRAIQGGAVDYLLKPYDFPRMRMALERSLEQSRAFLDVLRTRKEFAARYETLTAREREVLTMVVAGKPTKNIAHALGTSQNTVQNQRASILKKLQARSVVDIVRLTVLMQLDETRQSPWLGQHPRDLGEGLPAANGEFAGEAADLPGRRRNAA